MSFRYVNSTFTGFISGASQSVTQTLHAGNLVVPASGLVVTGGGTPSVVFSDGTNTYTVAVLPVGPENLGGGVNFWIAFGFNLSFPSTGSVTITATWTTNGTSPSTGASVVEFAHDQPIINFDAVSFASVIQNTAIPSQPIATPSITPSRTGSLLIANLQTNGTPTWLSPWTSPGGNSLGFVLASGSPPIAMNANDSTTPDTWMSYIAAFAEIPVQFDDYSPSQQQIAVEQRKVTVFS